MLLSIISVVGGPAGRGSATDRHVSGLQYFCREVGFSSFSNTTTRQRPSLLGQQLCFYHIFHLELIARVLGREKSFNSLHLLLFTSHGAGQETRMAPWIGFVLMAIAVFSKRVEGKRDEVLYCSACMAIADELSYSISQIDPKKTVHVGGFRLNPDGSLTEKMVPLARSETHLSELLDGVCNNMSDYALYEDPNTKEQSYKRFAPRSSEGGNFPDFKNFKFDGPEGSNNLKFACETIVEELEDDIISLFSREGKHIAQKLCSEVSDQSDRDGPQLAQLIKVMWELKAELLKGT